MSSIEKAVEITKSTKDLVCLLNQSDISYDDLTLLSEIVPSMSFDLETIYDWINNSNVRSDDYIEELTDDHVCDTTSYGDISEGEPNTPTNTHPYTDKEIVEEIGRYIANNCDGLTTIKAFNEIKTKYSDMKEITIKRIVYKYTFTKITDRFYEIKNRKIVAISKDDCDGTNNTSTDEASEIKIPDDIMFKDQISELINDMRTKGNASVSFVNEFIDIWKDITSNNGDITDSIKQPDVPFDTCIKYVSVKQMMLCKSIYPSYNDTDVVVMISDAVKKYGKRRTNRISNYISKHYRTDVPTSAIFNVLNKQMFPEISDKFFK